MLAECARDAAIAAGRLLTAILDVAANARPGFDADEIAFTLICSQNAARSQLELARFLHDTTPDVFAALCAGDIDAYRAWIFYEILHTAQVPIAAHVATAILPHAAALTPSELKQKLRRALLKADPAGATTRTRRTLADRYIAATHSEDGTASLYGVYLPAARVAAAIERIDAYARAARNAGDERTLAQLRADTFLDLLEGVTPTVAPIHRRGVIEITVPYDTATGASDEPGDITGHGPVDANTIRDLLTDLAARDDTDWRASCRDTDGTLIGYQTIRRTNRGTSGKPGARRSPHPDPDSGGRVGQGPGTVAKHGTLTPRSRGLDSYGAKSALKATVRVQTKRSSTTRPIIARDHVRRARRRQPSYGTVARAPSQRRIYRT